MNKKCSLCNKDLKRKKADFKSSQLNVKTGKPIVVKGVVEYICSDKNCDFAYLPTEEEKRIDNQIEKESRHYLTGEQITKLRKSLGFSSKFQAAKFLCLNEKTFTRWESANYTNITKSSELLLMMAAHSKKNFEFIQNLHETNFKFKEKDYEMLNARPEAEELLVDESKINKKEYPQNPLLPEGNFYPPVSSAEENKSSTFEKKESIEGAA